MKIHPEFDAETKTWFVPDRPEEAKSIRELLEKIFQATHKHVFVNDYFPAGAPPINYGVRTADDFLDRPLLRQHSKNQHKLPAGSVAQRSEPAPHKRLDAGSNPAVSTKIKVDQSWRDKTTDLGNRIIDLWASGYNGPQIAEIVGKSVQYVSSNIVWNARKRGDPRAMRRAPLRK